MKPWFARQTVLAALSLVAWGALASGPLDLELSRPALITTRTAAGTTRIEVAYVGPDGQRRQTFLRETGRAVARDASGVAAAGAAAFVRWDEAGSLWFAVSRDGGRSWSEARDLDTRVMLRDGQPSVRESMPQPGFGLSATSDSELYIVQFKTISLPEWRDALNAVGAQLLWYLPHNAYIAHVPSPVLPAVRALDVVERVERFHPWYRLSSEVRDWLAAPGPSGEARRLRVSAFEWGAAGKARIARAAIELGARIEQWNSSGHIIEIELTRDQLRALAAHNDLAWVDPWTPRENDMDLVREAAGRNWAEANYGFCGQGVRGEVLDAGVEPTHQDFDNILFHGSHDVDSHGTSTYGIVFGNGARDGDGQQKGEGNIPCAQGIFADYDFLTDRFVHTQQLKASPYFASFQSNSWGDARTRSYTSISQEMDDIIWRLDFAIAQSQSNAGNQDSRPQAWAKNIISVGGIQHKDTIPTGDDCWCSDASIGPAEDGRIKPDISYWNDSIYTTTTGNGYTSGFGGTSAATPEVAGILGTMVQMWSENVWNTNPVGSTVFERKPHAATIKALLINNAEQYSFSGTTSDLTRTHQGWGRPSIRVAKERSAQSFIIDQSVVLQVNDRVEYDIDVHAGEPELKVTLVYNDNPGTTSASLHRINDLDLVVTSPSGTRYFGNVGLDTGTVSVSGGNRDGKNNVENVFLPNPAAGIWKVAIEAREVNQDQHLATSATDIVFSLVTTGGAGSICVAPTADFTSAPNPARVGQAVNFDSTVSGGAGGPYTYSWDLNADGSTDSSDTDPLFVYNRPFVGQAKLTTRDSGNCPKSVDHTVTITGPDLRYEDTVNLTQVQGNNNGAIDPGEIWEMNVRLRNGGNELAGNVSAKIRPSSANAGPVSVLSNSAVYGDLPVGFVSSGTPYRFQVGQNFPCGNDATFDLVEITSADPNNVYPSELGKVKVLVGGAGAPQTFFTDGFETNLGWTFTGSTEWEIRNPLGKGGGQTAPGQTFQPRPDPTAAFSGTKVLGNDLTGLGPSLGNYEGNQQAVATSPPIDCSQAGSIQLQFARWLNVIPQDLAAVEVSRDGNTWTTIFSDSDGSEATSWTVQSFNVSAQADRNPNFRVRFRLNSDNLIQNSGWNVDELRMVGVTNSSCEPVARATPGQVKNLLISKGTAGTLNLSWVADCGGTTKSSVYRGNLSIGYASIAPESGKCDVSGTSTSIPQGASSADFFLIVPNDGGFEGSYGMKSGAVARPAAANPCHPRDRVNACTP